MRVLKESMTTRLVSGSGQVGVVTNAMKCDKVWVENWVILRSSVCGSADWGSLLNGGSAGLSEDSI